MILLQTLRLAAIGVMRNPRRTLLTVGVLANTVVAGLLFYGFTRHSYWGLAEVFARAGNGHVQVAAARWFDSPSPEEHRTALATLRQVQAAIEADPQLSPLLVGVGARRVITGMISDGERAAVFMGVGSEGDGVIAPLAAPVAGVSLEHAARPDSVVLGEPLAGRLRVLPGDLVTVMTTTDRGMTNAMDVEVVGLSRTGSEEMDRSSARLPIATALQLADSDQADLLVVALRDTADTDRALALVRRDLQAFPGLVARPWSSRASYYVAVKALYDRIFGIFEIMMIAVAALGLTHAIAAVVAERRSEIALLRVIGLKRRQVVWLFVAEGGLLGLLGTISGVLIAHAVAWGVAALGGIPMPPPPGFTEGYPLLFRFDALGYLIVVPATLLAATGASALPAWRASQGALSRTLAGLVVLFTWVVLSGSALAADVTEGQRWMALTDAARRVPADQVCTLDLTVTERAGAVGWRIRTQGERTVGVSTTLEPGRRQAVLQQGAQTWFQTEGMRRPMRVTAAQRVMGELSVADLLAPRLTTTWRVVSVSDGSPATVRVEAIPKGPASSASAELDFDLQGAAPVLRWARFYGASGRLLRTATWRWEDGVLRGVEVADATRPQRVTRVDNGPVRCQPGSLDIEVADLMTAALDMLGE